MLYGERSKNRIINGHSDQICINVPQILSNLYLCQKFFYFDCFMLELYETRGMLQIRSSASISVSDEMGGAGLKHSTLRKS